MRLSICKGYSRGSGADKRQLFMPRIMLDNKDLESLGFPERVHVDGSAEQGFTIKAVNKFSDDGHKLSKNPEHPNSGATMTLSPTAYGFNPFDRTLPSHSPADLEVSVEGNVLKVGPAPRITWAQKTEVPVSKFSNDTVAVRPIIELQPKQIKPMPGVNGGGQAKQEARPEKTQDDQEAPVVMRDDLGEVQRLANQVKLSNIPQLHMVLTAWKRVRELNMIRKHEKVHIKFQVNADGDLELVL